MSKKLPSDTFCVLPFMHVAVNPGGGFRVCCNSNPQNNKVLKDDGSGKAYRIFKDDVKEVKEGMECGIGLVGVSKFVEGDIIETYKITEIKRTLESS